MVSRLRHDGKRGRAKNEQAACHGKTEGGQAATFARPAAGDGKRDGDCSQCAADGEELAPSGNPAAFAIAAGQFRAPAAWRAELRGVIDFGFPVVWNIERGGR